MVALTRGHRENDFGLVSLLEGSRSASRVLFFQYSEKLTCFVRLVSIILDILFLTSSESSKVIKEA